MRERKRKQGDRPDAQGGESLRAEGPRDKVQARGLVGASGKGMTGPEGRVTWWDLSCGCVRVCYW